MGDELKRYANPVRRGSAVELRVWALTPRKREDGLGPRFLRDCPPGVGGHPLIPTPPAVRADARRVIWGGG